MRGTTKLTRRSAGEVKLVDTSPRTRRLDAEMVGKALGAKRVGSSSGFDLFSIREAMSQLLSPGAGRPGIEGTTGQAKIPRIEEDWAKLEKLTRASANLRHRPSITQTAAMVLHVALSRLSDEEIEAEIRRAFG